MIVHEAVFTSHGLIAQKKAQASVDKNTLILLAKVFILYHFVNHIATVGCRILTN